MRSFYLWISLAGLVFQSAAAHANGKVSFFHSLKGDIRQEWDDKNIECLNQLLSIIDGVQNFTLEATWIWDSMQLPNGVLYGSQYHLGNYDQCLKAPQGQNGVRTKYCLADVTLVDDNLVKHDRNFNPNDSTEKYLTTVLKCGMPLHLMAWGVCVPSSCDNDSVAKFLKVMLRYSAFHAASSPKITVESCEIAGAAKQYPTSYYLFWCFALLLITVTLLCTFYYNVRAVDAENSNYFRAKVVKAFCIKNNCHSLVKEIDGDIPCIYGIRLLAMILAVLMHYYLNAYSGPVNRLNLDMDLDKFPDFVHSTVGIDAFFVLSGLLSMKGLMARKKNPEKINVLLLKRYIRFLGALGIVLWYFMSVFEHSGNGPIWNRFVGRELNYCTKNWPLTLLLVNNYVNTDKICLFVTWNVSADFQLTVFCVVLFYLCLKLKYRAVRNLVISITLYALIAPGILNYWYRWPAEVVIDSRQYCDTNVREHPMFAVRYTKSFFHAGPYLIGMGLGYFLSVYKPSQHRNKISKKWSTIIYGTCIILGFMVFLSGNVVAAREYNAVEAAIYAATNRIIFALHVAALVLICEYGTPNMFSKLTSWRAFVPFSRLTYGVYLTHTLFIDFTAYSTRAPLTSGKVTVLVGTLGVLVMSFAASLIIWIFVEAPLINLTNVLLQSRKSNVSSPVEKDNSDSNRKLVEENNIDEENKIMESQYLYTNSESIRQRNRT